MVIEWNFLDNGTMSVKTPALDSESILPKYIADVFKTKEIIRTQDITQTGYAAIDIPSLDENKRWGHLIMSAQLMHIFLEKVKDIFEKNSIDVDYEELEIAEIVFACHDVGHTDNSHQSEHILKYPHEQRTMDIILGDTELGNLVCSQYSRQKVEKIVNLLTKNDVSQENLSPLLQVFSQLVSSGADLDKLAYTIADTTYAGIKSSIDVQKLFDAFGVDIDANGNYILYCDDAGQRQLEILDIEVFQNYRDVYNSPSDEIMRTLEPIMLELVENEPDDIKKLLPEPFLNKVKSFQGDSRVTTLEQELQMTDTPMVEAWKILSVNAQNPILRYLADMYGNRHDYYFVESNKDISDIISLLQEIFPDNDLSNTISLFDITSRRKMIKSSEEPWIRTKSGVLQKATEKPGCLINSENFTRRRIFFNPELLRLELGMTKEQFSEYQIDIDSFLNELFSQENEFQIKYVSTLDNSIDINTFIAFIEQHGFSYDGIKFEHNTDYYFETASLDLLKSDKEFRIRQSSSIGCNSKKYAFYKRPLADGQFSHKHSIKTSIKPGMTIRDVENIIKHRANENFDLEDSPFMDVSTSRSKLYFSRNGKKFSISWDDSLYNNRWLHECADDIMLEISVLGENSDKLILKNLQQIMQEQSKNFEAYTGSKVSRGVFLTYQKNKLNGLPGNNSVNNENELKCKFKESDRKQVSQILHDTLVSFGIVPLGEASINYQVDEYYDTSEYKLASKKESLRVRESGKKIIGTYKTPKNHSSTLTSRNEMNIQVSENSAQALINGAKSQYGVNLPENIDSVVQVENQRMKQDYSANGVALEIAIDDVHNVDLKTGLKKHADLGEFEIEFKDDISPEKADNLMNSIYLEVLRKCSEKGIFIKKSQFNKYMDALVDLGIIKDIDKMISIGG